MKILTLDIETSYLVGQHWSLWNQNFGLSQIQEWTRVIAFAAKWHGKPKIEFYSEFHNGHEEMVKQAWRMWDEADAVVHYNGTSFDMPHLRREFALAKLRPPSPVEEIDLMRVAKKKFRFASNKLDHISQQLGLEGKISHEGHALSGPNAWREIRRRGVSCDATTSGDVKLTEELYDILLPWIDSHPHSGLNSGEENVCARCGSSELKPRGFSYTKLSMFQRYRCSSCGSWSRGKNAIGRVDQRAVSQ